MNRKSKMKMLDKYQYYNNNIHMGIISPEATLESIIASPDAHCDDALQYVLDAYGRLPILQLLTDIEKTGRALCFNWHEYLLGKMPFTACPLRKYNNVCSHQGQADRRVANTIGEEQKVQEFSAGFYHAGLYVLEKYGKTVSTEKGEVVTHDLIENWTREAGAVDGPAYEEYTRFNDHDITQGGKHPSLEAREEGRHPVLKQALSLPVLKNVINTCKDHCEAPMDSIRDAVAGGLRELLGMQVA